ncbi:MAG: hypothetical protein KDK25_09850, partial [Leptospiraceae bacterium]|nr:hypothetical protein [Leptospiraceae bacterium]
MKTRWQKTIAFFFFKGKIPGDMPGLLLNSPIRERTSNRSHYMKTRTFLLLSLYLLSTAVFAEDPNAQNQPS